MKTILPASVRLPKCATITFKLIAPVLLLLTCFSNYAKAQTSQTITFNALAPVTYGASDFSPGATASSGLTVSYSSDNHLVATIVSGKIHIVGAGSANITASQGGGSGFSAAPNVVQSLMVNTATLTVTANDTTKTYGMGISQNLASTAFIATGLQNGETIGSVTMSYYTGSATTDGIGTYVGCAVATNAVGGTFNPNNYTTISYLPGNIIVNPAPLTITANDTTKTYGMVISQNPNSTAFKVTGLQNGETIGSVTMSYYTGSAGTDGIGTYVGCAVASGATGGSYNPNNYTAITYLPGNIIVNPALLTITANDVNKTYGTAITGASGSTAFSSVGLQNGETIGSVTIAYYTGSAITDGIGTYLGCVAASNPTGGTFNANNYTISFAAGNIIVGTAPLTITGIFINSKAFDGTTNATIGGTPVLVGAVSGDDVGIDASGATATFTSSAVGANISVIVSGYVLTGNTATNYSLTQPTGLTANIINSDEALTSITASAGTLSPAFSAATLAYTDSVSNATSGTTVTVTTANPGATVTVNGSPVSSGSPSSAISLPEGQTTSIPVVVSFSGDPTSQTYSVAITRAASSVATLSGLSVSAGNLMPAFAPGTTSYAFPENNITTSITLTPTAADPNATITVNGTPVASGTASGAINLNVGANPVTVVVTAQDGVTTQTYNLTVNRTLEANDNLLSLTTSSGVLSPTFSNATSGYSVSVPIAVNSITVTPTTSDPGAIVTVNGSPVTSGTASSSISLSPGPNTINVVVTAANGITTNTFTLTVTQTEAASAMLSALATNPGALIPGFKTTTTGYNVTVNNVTSTITLTPTAVDPSDAITVNGITTTSGSASSPVSLNVGSNAIPVVVTSPDGSTSLTYTVNVTRVLPSNANLLSLTTSSGVLSPTFSNATSGYSVSVPIAVNSITVTPTTSDPGATVTVNGSPVTSGTASSSISLSPGPNTINVVVTAANGITTNTFTLTVTQTEAASAMLSALATNPGALVPGFKTTTTGYNVTVNNVTGTITLTPTAVDPSDAITVNGITTASGSASSPVSLNVGSNAIPVVVAAPDGTTSLTYTVNVTRVLPSNDNLLSLTTSSGTLSPAFDKTTTSYTVTVPLAQSTIMFTPTAADASATIAVNGVGVTSGSASGAISLNEGSNTVNIMVTAENGITNQTYTITVNRVPSSNDNLSGIGLSSGVLSPRFDQVTTSYGVTVNNFVSSIKITPTTADPTATVTVKGTAVTSGTASASISLTTGINSIPVVVTAQDGVTTQTYTINVIRVLAANDNLSSLKLSSGTLSPAFAVGTTSYTASVANSVASITVTPTTSDPNGTVAVNDTAVVSGTASRPIALAVGADTVNVQVTASNGTTQQTYSVIITRAPGGADIFTPISVTKPTDAPELAEDGIVVHKGVSPNGDGIEDYLQIDNISQYPDNHLAIMNRNGQLVYEIKGYDNSTRVFDGHSNKNGQMQLPGTYFFALDYTVDGVVKHKTGFVVLKY